MGKTEFQGQKQAGQSSGTIRGEMGWKKAVEPRLMRRADVADQGC